MRVAALIRTKTATLQWQWSQSRVVPVTHNQRRCYVRRSGQEQEKFDAAFEQLLQHHRKSSASEVGTGNDALSAAKREWRWVMDEVRERRQASTLTREYEAEAVTQMIRRLVNEDEPMAYVLGHQPFGPLRIECAPPTLIPRTETEALTEHVAANIVQAIDVCAERRLRILDLCTGTGCMSLLIRHRLLQHAADRKTTRTFTASIMAVDVADAAIALTNRNASLYEQSAPCFDTLMQEAMRRRQVTFATHLADVMDDAAMQQITQRNGPFDVLVCNPPYIPLHEWQVLDRSVRDWEDRRALVGDVFSDGGEDKGGGLDFYNRLALLIKTGDLLHQPLRSASAFPIVAVEVGHDQASRVASLFIGAGLRNVHVWKDPFGIDRGVLSMPKA